MILHRLSVKDRSFHVLFSDPEWVGSGPITEMASATMIGYDKLSEGTYLVFRLGGILAELSKSVGDVSR
jgi:hypothetical protein